MVIGCSSGCVVGDGAVVGWARCLGDFLSTGAVAGAFFAVRWTVARLLGAADSFSGATCAAGAVAGSVDGSVVDRDDSITKSTCIWFAVASVASAWTIFTLSRNVARKIGADL